MYIQVLTALNHVKLRRGSAGAASPLGSTRRSGQRGSGQTDDAFSFFLSLGFRSRKWCFFFFAVAPPGLFRPDVVPQTFVVIV